MKKNKLLTCFTIVFVLVFLCSCSRTPENSAADTLFEIGLTRDYDNADPFVNERLFYVTDNVDRLDFDVSFQLQGESGTIEIANNETGEVLWSESWDGNVDQTKFTITLQSLDKENEYVFRLAGTKIESAKAIAATDLSLVKERSKPQRKS